MVRLGALLYAVPGASAQELFLASLGRERVSRSSAEYCASKGMAGGEVIGTSPACEGACQDCGEQRACEAVSKATGLDDYGAGCWSGDKVLCCSPVLSNDGGDADHLTVLTQNTYLMEVNVVATVNKKPDLARRAAGIAQWLRSLRSEEVPDVVVLQEIFSSAAQGMMQQLCTADWEKNSEYYAAAVNSRGWLKKCDPGSQFEFATSVVGPTSDANPRKCGGAVVLTKRGIAVERFHDEVYNDYGGDETLARKGFFAVQFTKGPQRYWVLGTHTQAYDGDDNINIRLSQFQQMRRFVEANAQASDRVVFAGDLNVFTGDSSGGREFADETDGMLQALHASAGEHVPGGFWLPLDAPLRASADNVRNHYVSHLEPEFGAQQFDWVLAYRGAELPQQMHYQIVPMKSDECFASELAPGNSDDLSDHYGVFASLCYRSDGCAVEPVQGHRGSGSKFPSDSPNC